MLKNYLYNIEEINYDGVKLLAQIFIDAKHSIFQGHFPEVPVLPGVTMMQMVKEVLEDAEGKAFIISQASSLKFLQMLNPVQCSRVFLEILVSEKTESFFKVKAQLSSENATHFKMTAQFSIQ